MENFGRIEEADWCLGHWGGPDELQGGSRRDPHPPTLSQTVDDDPKPRARSTLLPELSTCVALTDCELLGAWSLAYCRTARPSCRNDGFTTPSPSPRFSTTGSTSSLPIILKTSMSLQPSSSQSPINVPSPRAHYLRPSFNRTANGRERQLPPKTPPLTLSKLQQAADNSSGPCQTTPLLPRFQTSTTCGSPLDHPCLPTLPFQRRRTTLPSLARPNPSSLVQEATPSNPRPFPT